MPQHTCSFDGCSRQVMARKMCRKHYNRWYYERHGLRPELSLNCLYCGTEFQSKKSATKFCSQECAGRYGREFSQLELLQQRLGTTYECEFCGVRFVPLKSLARKVCSDRCARMKTIANAPVVACSKAGCDRQVQARGLCKKHYSAWRRAEGLETWKHPWDEKRKLRYQKRRAIKKGVDAEDIVSLKVYERDNWTCGICGGSVDPDVAWPDSMSASLDHVVPLSKGGSHTYANVQCAHLSCNVRKSDSLPSEREALVA